ncbi:MAG: nucleotide pyrophosphohydrolase [Bacteroidales bacterium]|nr:nucleotide pyrophosphohydrolase [Bacteroidales bacterium]HOY38338.1 nucleotide pyrophosphohydrolase [Bacteroidales bacterium]HQP03433.1 nucleotide pyrophosphohydrolase [Bacteroidales bacterium]
MTISESQQMVDQWIAQHGVRYFNVLTNMTILTEEIGELARVVARIYGEQSPKPNEKLNLSEEMADVLWVLICLANQTGVNLEEAFLQTITKKTNRDSLRHINNPKLK